VKAHGRQTGAKPKGSIVECPYWQEHPDLQRAWMAGFHEGRSLLEEHKARLQAAPDAEAGEQRA
jgi:hypothetical protein